MSAEYVDLTWLSGLNRGVGGTKVAEGVQCACGHSWWQHGNWGCDSLKCDCRMVDRNHAYKNGEVVYVGDVNANTGEPELDGV